MKQKIRIFIGSSVEGLPVAREIQEKLDFDSYSVEIWDEVYNLTTQTLERLDEIKNRYHFGIFVLSADDIIETRGCTLQAVRDNVVLELGLFIDSVASTWLDWH